MLALLERLTISCRCWAAAPVRESRWDVSVNWIA